jgi:hypothetical protein
MRRDCKRLEDEVHGLKLELLKAKVELKEMGANGSIANTEFRKSRANASAIRDATVDTLWPGMRQGGRVQMYWVGGPVISKLSASTAHKWHELHMVCPQGDRRIFKWIDVPQQAGGGGVNLKIEQ